MPTDKILHVLAGYAISLTAGMYNTYAGLGIAIVAGAFKELYDYYHQDTHSVEAMDFYATAFGGVVGFVVMRAIN